MILIKRNGACYFLHASDYWHVCWCVRMRLHASNGEDCYGEDVFANIDSKHLQQFDF